MAKLLLLLASTTLALLVGEIAVRALLEDVLPPYPERALWQYDDLLGWSHPPRQEVTIRHSEYQIVVRTNADGLRDRDYSQERAPSLRRLLLLGDSFAWGLGVEQPEIFLERIEQRYPGWEMINAGVSGYGTDQQLLYYRDRGSRLNPDVVLVLLHENDYRNNAALRQQGRNKPRFRQSNGALVVENQPVPPASLSQRLERRVLRHSRLLGVLYLRTREAIFRATGSEPARDPEITVRLLAALAEEVEAKGARLVVASVPMSKVKREPLARQLEALSIPYLPLDDAFEQALASEIDAWRKTPAASSDPTSRPVSPFRYQSDFHWNARGHRVAATAIEGFLIAQGILGSDEANVAN